MPPRRGCRRPPLHIRCDGLRRHRPTALQKNEGESLLQGKGTRIPPDSCSDARVRGTCSTPALRFRGTHPDLVDTVEAAQVRAVGVVQIEHLRPPGTPSPRAAATARARPHIPPRNTAAARRSWRRGDWRACCAVRAVRPSEGRAHLLSDGMEGVGLRHVIVATLLRPIGRVKCPHGRHAAQRRRQGADRAPHGPRPHTGLAKSQEYWDGRAA